MKTDLSELYIELAPNARRGAPTKPGWYFVETKKGFRAMVYCDCYNDEDYVYYPNVTQIYKRGLEKSGRFTPGETAKYWPVKYPPEWEAENDHT